MAANDQRPGFSFASMLRHLACGCAMGISDAVPGVSGGTIALILGIYQRLIGSIHSCLAVLKRPLDRQSWQGLVDGLVFLVPLGIGAVSALYITLKLLVGHKPELDHVADADLDAALLAVDGLLLHPHTAPIVFGAFFGLVLASLVEPWSRRQSSQRWHWLAALAGTALSASLSLLPSAAGSAAVPMLILAGAVAISVMLLPGISGSLALLVIGMYQPISQAVTAKDIGTLFWVVCGVLLGVCTTVPSLRWLLTRHNDGLMAFLTGLMAGSLVALWPWKAHYLPNLISRKGPMLPEAPQGAWWWVILAALIGAAVIVISRHIAGRSEREGAAT